MPNPGECGPGRRDPAGHRRRRFQHRHTASSPTGSFRRPANSSPGGSRPDACPEAGSTSSRSQNWSMILSPSSAPSGGVESRPHRCPRRAEPAQGRSRRPTQCRQPAQRLAQRRRPGGRSRGHSRLARRLWKDAQAAAKWARHWKKATRARNLQPKLSSQDLMLAYASARPPRPWPPDCPTPGPQPLRPQRSGHAPHRQPDHRRGLIPIRFPTDPLSVCLPGLPHGLRLRPVSVG